MEGLNSIRCFFAIVFDELTRAAIHQLATQIQIQYSQPDIKWVAENNYHLTLRFMGSVEINFLDDLLNHVRKSLKNIPGFTLEMHTPFLFPKWHPHVISLQCEPKNPILLLANAIESAVINAGFSADTRPFKAHLTLARFKKLPADFKFESFTNQIKTEVKEIVFMQSLLGSSESKYKILERIKLQNHSSDTDA